MTISEVLARVDRLKPNSIAKTDKVLWLSDCDTNIFKSIMRTHAPDESTPDAFAGYDDSISEDTVLLAEPPYDELYTHYLSMHIDMVNMELNKYNNNAALYNGALMNYAGFYTRTHRPIHPVNSVKL